MDDESIKCQGKDGKLLFEWNPAMNIISIVRKDMFYRVKLLNTDPKSSYQVIEEHPKKMGATNPTSSVK